MANKYHFLKIFKIVFFYEPLKHDTYSPYMSLIICTIFCYLLAIFWATTFENPSINVTAPSKSNRLGVPWRIHHTLRHCVPAPQLLISTAIFWGINFENPSITVESGRNGVTCGGFVKVHPDACFCSERSQMKNWRRFEIRSSTFWKSVYKCGAGTQWRTGTVSGSVKTHPHDCFCSKRFVFIASSIKSEQDPGVRDGHRVGRYGIKRGARMASDKYCAPPATAQPSPGPEFEHTRNIQFWSRFFSMFQGTHVT